jgi:hypothetical protein
MRSAERLRGPPHPVNRVTANVHTRRLLRRHVAVVSRGTKNVISIYGHTRG